MARKTPHFLAVVLKFYTTARKSGLFLEIGKGDALKGQNNRD